ncbi:glycosyl hydrolase family 8 [Carboxylicivirga sp. N1Y90]|uniref:glycosyl hydrolase family 8 n=1 Tax=Carboxylicivirga fragile TaxID=3417571 RepID=UPI003D3482E1|nr:hypothetical protein [Marinilabiliaceae bacterium N1Y90]
MNLIQYKLAFLLLLPFLLSCGSDELVRPEKKVVEPEEPVFVEAKHGFPSNIDFANCIKPNHKTQDELNADVISYYNYWKGKYVKTSNGKTPGGGYYVSMKGTGGDGSEITTSEAHGYGMIIFALMAGHDKDAKKYYDGFYNMYDKHRSTGNSYCMSWVIHESESSSEDQGSATDGDMDVMYSLLLADKQWGSESGIDYLAQSQDGIKKGLKIADMSTNSKRVMMGDWDSNQWSTRSSDWMTAHFRNFAHATNDGFWLDASSTVYALIASLTTNYSPNTGLMPDFIVDQTPKPAPENYLDEFKETDEYNWNACRYPWRITTDYAHFGTNDAQQAMKKLMDFIIDSTDGQPSEIKAGYYLNGSPMVSYKSGAFTAPLVSASMVDVKYQDFLNAGWDEVSQLRDTYYGDTLCLLNMLLISGNWWNPKDM